MAPPRFAEFRLPCRFRECISQILTSTTELEEDIQDTDTSEVDIDSRTPYGASWPNVFIPGRTNGTRLDKGILLTWTKGFAAKNAVKKDVVGLLQDAFDRKHLHVKCVALMNNVCPISNLLPLVIKMTLASCISGT